MMVQTGREHGNVMEVEDGHVSQPEDLFFVCGQAEERVSAGAEGSLITATPPPSPHSSTPATPGGPQKLHQQEEQQERSGGDEAGVRGQRSLLGSARCSLTLLQLL